MRNMKIRLKLATGFMCMALLICLIAAGGLYGLFRMGGIAGDMYEHKARPMGDLATAMEYFQRLRVQTRNAIIYAGDLEQLTTVEADIKQRMEQFQTSMEAYRLTLATEEGITLLAEIDRQFQNVFEPGIEDVLAGAKRGDPGMELLESMDETTASADIIANHLSRLIEIRMEVMDKAYQESIRVKNLISTVDAIVIFATLCTAFFLSRYVSGIIRTPLVLLSDFMKRAGSTGDIKITQEDERALGTYAQYKDETGECIQSTMQFVRHVTSISEKLHSVSNGDLSIEITPLSAEDIMGTSMKNMVDNLNRTFSEIQRSTAQVASGSKQVADDSQLLAQGATEQAAAVEQLSSSVSEITQKTKDNADMASNAADLALTIKQNAETGNTQMDQMMEAVKEINEASQSISKVIKVIDDIAFQTNILALNAAVEAARAGQHGKGFAVVAEEVRNLAAKSAEAAKDTGGLIANSMEKAELGARIAGETAASLREIVTGINKSSQIVSEIAQSSDEQAAGISQLNRGIEQVSQVTQQNSATAEESSAASEEMSGQANVLEELISQFKLADGYSESPRLHAPSHTTPNRLDMPVKRLGGTEGINDGFGKY